LALSAALTSLIITSEPSIRGFLLTFLVLLWGLRLSYHLFRRNWNKEEDYRYKAMREKWGDSNPYVTAYFRVFMPQLILLFIIVQPVLRAKIIPELPLAPFNAASAMDSMVFFTEDSGLDCSAMVYIVNARLEPVSPSGTGKTFILSSSVL